MKNKSSVNIHVMLLPETDDGREGESKKKLWRKVVDVEEAKIQLLFSLPMILANVFYYLIILVSVMFSGHLGEVQLAGATLGNSWATVTGLAFMVGLSGALETLCGQGFGANMHRMLGIYLQSSCIISFFFSTTISVLWFHTKPILVRLHQESEISAHAAHFIKYLVPGLFAFGFLQNLLRFLQAQSVVVPLALFSLIPLCIHIGVTYALVSYTALGFEGGPVAASISLWSSVVMLLLYVIFGKQFKDTWDGFSMESFGYLLIDLKLALPSAAMICLEYWAFEILVILAGLMPSSEITTPLMAMCVNTEAISTMLINGLSAAVSTRVSNELGASNVRGAKKAMTVTLKLSACLALAITIALAAGHDIWASFFTHSTALKRKFASMVPFVVISITFDSFQGVLSGVARGCGWQHKAVYVNLATFYCIGMPLACLFGFKLKLYVKGLWIGLTCGLSCQAGTLFAITMCTKWTRSKLSRNSDLESGELGTELQPS